MGCFSMQAKGKGGTLHVGWRHLLLLAWLCHVGKCQSPATRQKRQQPNNMPMITGLDVTCEKTGMKVDLKFSAPFNGVVFSKGHFSNPACRYVKNRSGRSKLQIKVPLSSCGTQTVESSTERLMIENTIIIQNDPKVQDTWDSARKITCDWQSKLEKMVTFAPFGVADLLQVAEVKFAGSGDNVRTRMEIQFGRGPFAPPLEGLTKIGDELTVVVYAEDGGGGYDILVKNCYAYDSRNFKRANKIRLLNDHGCLFRPHQMEYFRRTFDTRSSGADIIAFARMNAFKFPDKMDVFLSCELEMCKGGCDTHCEMEDYPIDIIESLGPVRQPLQSQETDSVPVTTFRPRVSSDKLRKTMKRRRKPKKFGRQRVKDDAGPLLSPPSVTLSPEILELLEELGAEDEVMEAQERSSEAAPFEGNTNSLENDHHDTKSLTAQDEDDPLHQPAPNDNKNHLNKMSFSTIFAGTHTTKDQIPAEILNRKDKFKPSQLLAASIEHAISAQSHGSTGATEHPARIAPHVSAAARLGHANRLTNILQQEGSQDPAFFKPAKPSDENAGLASTPSPAIKEAEPSDNNNNKVSTLQQQLVQTEGQFVCAPDSLDVKCNPKSNDLIGGFRPISTTPNAIVSSTVEFTSQRSMDNFVKQISEASPNQPINVLMKIMESDDQTSAHVRQPRKDLRASRARFGSRLANNAKRFASFFGARRRKRAADGSEWITRPGDRNVFDTQGRETVNMVRGFQVVSSADLAFDPNSMQSGLYETRDGEGGIIKEQDICFPETAFYAGLLVGFSLLMISGLVSICAIRALRRQRRKRVTQRYFGGDTSLQSYDS